jgi:membrane protease YdiL (CAAX protease family)
MTAALRRTAALLEVLGVAAAGPLLGWWARKTTGLSIHDPLSTLRADTSGHDLLVGAWWMFVILLFQYAGYFLLAGPLDWWFRRKGPADYGLTRAGIPWPRLGQIAVATAALCAWPLLAFTMANPNPGDQTVPWRQAFLTMPMTWQAWVFAGVASWALVPVLEELFFRGYVLRRLEEDWGTGPAIIGSACLFTFGHTQYLTPNSYNLYILALIVLFAIGLGVAFALTRSIIPGIAAHVLINFPIRNAWLQAAVIAVAILLSVVLSRRALGWLRRAFRSADPRAAAALAVVAVLYRLVWARDEWWITISLSCLLLIAIGLQVWERRAPTKPKFA